MIEDRLIIKRYIGIKGTGGLATGDNDAGGEFKFEDSSLLFGFSKFLFDNIDYGFATIGIKTPEGGDHMDHGDDGEHTMTTEQPRRADWVSASRAT